MPYLDAVGIVHEDSGRSRPITSWWCKKSVPHAMSTSLSPVLKSEKREHFLGMHTDSV
jgi:hypothetical protein